MNYKNNETVRFVIGMIGLIIMSFALLLLREL